MNTILRRCIGSTCKTRFTLEFCKYLIRISATGVAIALLPAKGQVKAKEMDAAVNALLQDSRYERYCLDDLSMSDLLPVHRPAPWWTLGKYDGEVKIGGDIVSIDGESALKVIRTGDTGWGYFGRPIDLNMVRALLLRCKADKSLSVEVQLWTKYIREDIGGWASPGACIYKSSFTVKKVWTTPVLDLNDFVQTKGKRQPLNPADIKALIIVPTSECVLYFDSVSMLMPPEAAAKRRIQATREEIDFRKHDLVVLQKRGYPVASLMKELEIISADNEKAFENIAERIDLWRRVYRLKCRLSAIENWLPLIGKSELSETFQTLSQRYAGILPMDYSEQKHLFKNLSRDTGMLWNRLWPILCKRKVSWSVVRGTITREDGKRINLYGMNDVQIAAPSGPVWWRGASRADYERLAELGFNAIRMVITHRELQPEKGKYNQALLEKARECAEWAAESGIYCVIDLHFGHPEWTYQGPEGYKSPTGKQYHCPYPFLDNIAKTHQILTVNIGMLPNVVGQEVPFNEPSLRGCEKGYAAKSLEDRTIATLPWFMQDWNQYLKKEYGSRKHLAEAWEPDFPDVHEKGLGQDEDWQNNSILPPGARGEDKWASTRINDYIEWTVELHTQTCQRLAEAIKEINPGILVFQQQFLGSSAWSGEPIPYDSVTLQQLCLPGIDGLAAHYNLGMAPYTLPVTGCYWYNGELPQAGWEPQCRLSSQRGGGTLFWAYSSIPDPRQGFRCLMPHGRLKPNRRYITLMSDVFQKPVPVLRDNVPVAIVCNARLCAVESPRFESIANVLKSLEYEYDIINSLYLKTSSGILDKYQAVFCPMDYLDSAIIPLLAHSNKPVFFYGSLNRDISARKITRSGIPLFEEHYALRISPLASSSIVHKNEISLEGNWQFALDPADEGEKAGWETPQYNDSAWYPQRVPAAWENADKWEVARNYDGVAWYRKHIMIPKQWAGNNIVLEIGAVDDFDQAFFNGQPIGCTTRSTPNWWTARRIYSIASNLTRFGETNTIAIRVMDDKGMGGIVKGPVRLMSQQQQTIRFLQNFGTLKQGDNFLQIPACTLGVPQGDKVLARFEQGEPALMRFRNALFYFVQDIQINKNKDVDIIRSFLKEAGL